MAPAWTRVLMALAFALASLPTSAAVAPSLPLDGYWSGWAERDGVRSEIAVRLITRNGEESGTVDWPAMGYFRVDLLGVKIDQSDTRFSVPLPIGALKLLGRLHRDSITGTLEPIGLVRGEWQSLGKGGAFELVRRDEPVISYGIEDVTFQSGDATIAGSLFLPLDKTPRPGVVFVAGSGNTTRGDGSFLADRLARTGIATLVYDKRGAGRSSGDWRRGGFEELAADATEALKLLQRRPGIEPVRTGFVCQSQGCWIVPIALRSGAPARFLVAQSGPGVSVSDEDLDFYRVTLISQGFGPADVDEAFKLVGINQRVSMGSASWAELEAAIAKYRDLAWFQALSFSPLPIDAPERVFERKTLAYDPAVDLDAIRIPSLWIYGDADTIIPVQDSIDTVRKAKSVPRPEVVILRGAGHSFTVGQAIIPRLAAEYPDLVIDWINQRE